MATRALTRALSTTFREAAHVRTASAARPVAEPRTAQTAGEEARAASAERNAATFSTALYVVRGHWAFAVAKVIRPSCSSFMMSRWRRHCESDRSASVSAADSCRHRARQKDTGTASCAGIPPTVPVDVRDLSVADTSGGGAAVRVPFIACTRSGVVEGRTALVGGRSSLCAVSGDVSPDTDEPTYTAAPTSRTASATP